MFEYFKENQTHSKLKLVNFSKKIPITLSAIVQSGSKGLVTGSVAVMVAAIGLNTAVAATESSPNLYKVQRGDTLLGVANKFQISPSELASENKKNVTDNLITNEILVLPATVFASSMVTSVPPKTATVKTPMPSTSKTSTSKISTPKINTTKTSSPKTSLNTATTSTTKNPFYDNNSSGVAKVVPGLATTKTTVPSPKTGIYTVQTGDTLSSVAKKYHISATDLQKNNPNLPTARLQVGQKIIVPVITTASTITTPSTLKPKTDVKTPNIPATKTTSGKIVIESYKVKQGDSLISLARRYNLTVNDIAKINHILPDTPIKIGQQLVIPIPATAHVGAN